MSVDTERLTRLQLIASIASSIAIPIVITIAGWLVQTSISTEGIRKDYVQIAITVLSAPEKQVDPELRVWATKVLQKNSPVAFSSALITKLPFVGLFSPAPFPSPPSALMEPPAKLPVPRDNLTPTQEQLLNTYQQFEVNALKLVSLQGWVREMKEIDDKHRAQTERP